MFNENNNLSESNIRQMDPLIIAYIGDSIYESFIRERLILKNKSIKSNDMHILAVSYVKASSQSAIMEFIEGNLNEEEIYFYKRGRNSKSNHIPKNAVVIDYKRATGFQTLIGYLYLRGNKERLVEVMEMSAKIIEENILNETK